MKNLYLLLAALIISVSTAVDARAALLTGIVRDAASGAPVDGANVRIQGLPAGTVTDASGRFALTSLEPAIYILHVTHIGFAPLTERLSLEGDRDLDLRIKPSTLPGETITVYAARAVERETPATFSNLEREELEKRFHVQGIPSLLSELPSTTTYSESGNEVGYTYLSLRGFDQRRISVMVNGIPQNDPEDHNVYRVNFPDLASSLEDIQVQRGAGSAFYGPAAIGGSINLVTDRFGQDPRVTLTTGYGSYDTRKFGVTLNSGLLGNSWALNAHMSKTQTDGYRRGAWADFLSYFIGAAHYTERSSTRFHFYGSINKDHLNYYGIPRFDGGTNALDDRELRRANPITGEEEIEDFHQPHYELLHEYTLNPAATLYNTLFYVQGGGFFDFDGTGWADETYYRLTPEFGFTPVGTPGQSLVRAYVNNRQVGWLPRLEWKTESSTTDIGLEARYHRSLHYGQIRWAENLPAEVTPDYRFYEYKGSKWIASAYASHNRQVTERLNLSGSLQVAWKRYRLYDEAYVGNDFSVPFTFLNPRLGANLNLTERTNVYASIARTTREPRLVNFYDAANSSFYVEPEFERDATGRLDFDSPLARPEKLNNLEAGVGYAAAGLRGSANVFWMDFRDEIVKNGQLDQFGQPVTGNADRTLHRGLELVSALRLGRFVTLQGNLTFSRNTFKDYTVYESGEPVSYDGNRIAGFPDFLANLRASFERRAFRASLSLQHVGRQFTDNSENNRLAPDARNAPGYSPLYVDPYTVLDLGLAYDLGTLLGLRRLEIRLDINNVLNTLYETHGEADTFFPAATRNAFVWMKIDL